jgi:CubicO group peptidase (beta-lactamase class C family)
MNRRRVTRRAILKSAWSASAFALSSINDAPSQTQSSNEGLQPDERSAMSDVAYTFMAKNRIPGLAVAIAKDGEIAYSEGFGLANKPFGTAVTPSHLFRIASISKPITSVAIFQLIEQGRLSLADKVFGADGILSDYDLPIDDQRIRGITIDHLLTHTAGGWTNEKSDPMFSQLGMSHRQLIVWTLANVPLLQPPGTKFAYSNFGYCVLGRVIERKTGQSYADYISHSVLRPIQVEGMRIAGNTLEQRLDNEVVYYRQGP